MDQNAPERQDKDQEPAQMVSSSPGTEGERRRGWNNKGRRWGKKWEKAVEARGEPDDSADAVTDPFDLYEAMKAVLSQPAARDRTELQKVCRRNLREKPQWFQAEFAKAQAGAKAAGVTHVTPEPVAEKPLEKDVGTEKVVALVDRLLREWADERSG